MIHFQPYPIYIIYSRHMQEAAGRMAQEFRMQGDDHMYSWMTWTGSSKMEIVEDSAPIHYGEARNFENNIKKELDLIARTEVGRCLFNSFAGGTKLYIIPSLVPKAITRIALKVVGDAVVEDPKGGGGIRIGINPSDWPGTLDNTLVHEITHAMRYSHNRMEHRKIGHPDFGDAEEFYATQVENVYRSSLGKTGLYGSYNEFQEGKWSAKGTIYSTFVDTPILIMALKYCLDEKDGLAKKLSRLPLNKPDFNPFRDYPTLERMALGKTQIQGLPAGKFMPL